MIMWNPACVELQINYLTNLSNMEDFEIWTCDLHKNWFHVFS